MWDLSISLFEFMFQWVSSPAAGYTWVYSCCKLLWRSVLDTTMHNLSLTHSTFSYITVPCSYNFLRYPAHGMLSFGCLLQSHILSAGARGQSQASRQLVCLTLVPPPSHSLNLGLQKQQPGCTQHPPSLPLDTAIKQSTVYSKMTHYLIKHTAGKQMMSCRVTKDLSILFCQCTEYISFSKKY